MTEHRRGRAGRPSRSGAGVRRPGGVDVHPEAAVGGRRAQVNDCSWLGVHHSYVNADRLIRLARAESSERVRAYWAAIASWLAKDRRLARHSRAVTPATGTELSGCSCIVDKKTRRVVRTAAMPFHVSMSQWSRLEPEVLHLVRQFSIERATRRSNERVSEDWWKAAESTRPRSSQFSLSGQYESPLAYALEGVLDSKLMLDEWRRSGRRASQVLHLAPFLFQADDDSRWVELTAASGLGVMLGNPISLMEGWPGAFLDAEGLAFKERSADALNAVHADRWPTGADGRAEQAALAAEYALHELLWEAWAQCVPVVVQW